MRTTYLISREIQQRKANFVLSLLAIVAATAMFVSFFTAGQASKQETIRLMRNIGFNLRIIPKDTDMEQFWKIGYSEYTMPESSVHDLGYHAGFSYAHLTAILQRKVIWRNREVFLIGMAAEVSPPGKKKPPMAFSIERGTVYVGYELADKIGLKKGQKIDIYGKQFSIERTLSESGTDDDIRIYAHLHDVQDLLNEKKKINEIKALQCLCVIKGKNINDLTMLRKQLSSVLPDAKVLLIQNIASARKRQRMMAEKYFVFVILFVAVVCLAWIGILALMNVRERRREIGIMRALGYGSAKIAFLFLGKAAVIGLIGAALGFALGTGFAIKFGPDIFKVTANIIRPQVTLLYWALVLSPTFCSLAVFIPTMLAVTQDPAFTLREE